METHPVAQASPDNLPLLRMVQAVASEAGHLDVRRRHRAMAAAPPRNTDLHDMALRCLSDGSEQEQCSVPLEFEACH